MNKLDFIRCVVFVMLIFSSFYSSKWLGNDSFYYLRISESARNGYSDLLINENGTMTDTLRLFPQGQIYHEDFFVQVFNVFQRLFFSVNHAAIVFTYLLVFLCGLVIAGIVFLFTKNKSLCFFAALFFWVHPSTRLMVSFDSHWLRLLLFLFAVFVFVYLMLQKSLGKFKNISIFFFSLLIIVINHSKIKWFFNQLFFLSSLDNITELRRVGVFELFSSFPTINLLILFFLSLWVLYRLYKIPGVPFYPLMFLNFFTFGIFCVGLSMIRFMIFSIPLMIVLSFSVYHYLQKIKRHNDYLRVANFIYCTFFLILLIQSFFFRVPDIGFWTVNDYEEIAVWIKGFDNVVVLDWWDHGYYWQYKSDSPTFFDGASFNHENKFVVSDLFYCDELTSYKLLSNIRSLSRKDIFLIIDEQRMDNLLKFSKELSSCKNDLKDSVGYKMKNNRSSLFLYQKIKESGNHRLSVWRAKNEY